MIKWIVISIVFLFATHSLAQNANLDSTELALTQLPNPDSLERLLTEKKEDTSKAKLYGVLSYDYALNKAEKGLFYGQKGLQLSQKLGYTEGIAYCTQSLAFSLWALGDYNASLQLFLKALHQFEELENYERTAYTHLLLAGAYRDIGDYKRALLDAYQGTKINESIHVSKRIGYAIIGSIYELAGQLDSAFFYVQKARELDVKTMQTEWGWLYTLLGNINRKMKHYDTALSYYRSALPLVVANNFSKDIVDIYNAIAKLYKETGKMDSSIFYASEVLQKLSSVSFQKGVLEAVNILAEVYKTQNRKDSALKYLELSIALNNKMFSRENERDIQNLAFNEQLRQDEIVREHEQYRNKLKVYGLVTAVIVFLVIAVLLWRNNNHRKKAYKLLQKQKQETDTQKNKVERALSELKSIQAQLIQSEKMASLGELTAGIAHEIQNPLNFVNNFSEVSGELIDEMNAEIDKGNTEDVKQIALDLKQNLEKINHHGKRAGDIVKGMLQHTHSSGGVKEPTNINALADEYLRLAYHGLRAKDNSFNATLKTDFDKTMGKINIIPPDIGRVLLNLYNNAFYSVHEKNKQHSENYQPVISVTTKKLLNKIEVHVKDNGNGIPQKVLDKIFQPFFTTKPTGEGTGLGLSLSYDIVKAHGGELKVETKEGEFTELIIQLPILA